MKTLGCTKNKRAEACPECGEARPRYAFICRQCYKNSGGLSRKVHDEIFGEVETSDRPGVASRWVFEAPRAADWYDTDALTAAAEDRHS